MNVSSRWCVTAFVALGSLACSDPVPPPAQGAFIANITAASPPIPDKSCPAGTAFTYDVPVVREKTPAEALDGDTYLHRTIDGESGSSVSCTVKKGGAGFSFSGKINSGGLALELSDGTLGAGNKGTARVFLVNTVKLSSPLISPGAICTIDAAPTGAAPSYQVKAGSMWAHFSCTSVENPPGEACRAEGTFVLENCVQ